VSKLAELYIREIQADNITIEDVPVKLKETVEAELARRAAEAEGE